VVSWTGSRALLWDRNGGWSYDPARAEWDQIPTLGTFDKKRATMGVAVAVGDTVMAVAWFRTTKKIRLATLVGSGDDAAWEWLDGGGAGTVDGDGPADGFDGELAEVHPVGDGLIFVDADAKAYHHDIASGRTVTFDEFPSRAVRDHLVVPVGTGLAVLGNLVETKSIPNDVTPDELNVERASEILAVPDMIRLGNDPDNGLPVFVLDGKFGPYVQLGETPKRMTDDNKPPTSSLFEDMKMEELTLDQALDLLTIPRVIGTDPSDGLEITARNGPHGPYLTKPPVEEGKRGDTRSFEDEHKLLSMTLDEAVAMFAQPKRRRGQRATGPLKELGVDPSTDLPVVVRSGQFGEYVTDGEVNASLTANDSVERIDITRASELLAARRTKIALEGGAPAKKAAKKAAARKKAKKAAAKKSTAKTAKKSTAKKAVAPKSGSS
jgi:topoisomerase IA-like protein